VLLEVGFQQGADLIDQRKPLVLVKRLPFCGQVIRQSQYANVDTGFAALSPETIDRATV
jgi:hypothetical protein